MHENTESSYSWYFILMIAEIKLYPEIRNSLAYADVSDDFLCIEI